MVDDVVCHYMGHALHVVISQGVKWQRISYHDESHGIFHGSGMWTFRPWKLFLPNVMAEIFWNLDSNISLFANRTSFKWLIFISSQCWTHPLLAIVTLLCWSIESPVGTQPRRSECHDSIEQISPGMICTVMGRHV